MRAEVLRCVTMRRFGPLAICALALVACNEKGERVAENIEDKLGEIGGRAADRANDVAEKTASDAKIIAKETSEEAKRVAGKTAVAADQASDEIEQRVGQAGDRIDNAAEQVTDIAQDGVPEPASANEVAETLKDLDTAIQCDGAGKCTVTREFATRLRERPDVMAAQAQLEPAPDGSGLRMRNLGDLPKKVGLEMDDVITAINGVRLDKGNQVLSQLVLQLSASRFEIDYLRKGAQQSLQIDVV